MDDLQTNLESYYLQIQQVTFVINSISSGSCKPVETYRFNTCVWWFQVDAALTTDPGNDELLKLKTDLQEVIDLTKELLTQSSEPSGTGGGGTSLDYGKSRISFTIAYRIHNSPILLILRRGWKGSRGLESGG